MTSFYNDAEPYVAKWLRNLIICGEISDGDVLEESITTIEAWQVAGYTRAHFFAGIGGWDYALQLAGWPADVPVWTGSCPCQPFSVAGKRKGINDDRHLWPYFCNLIRQCKPPIIFGEQVASADGRQWLAGVFADLESLGYAVAGADLCAAGVGAPHIRQRLYWVAFTQSKQLNRSGSTGRGWSESSNDSRLGDDDDARLEGRRLQQGERRSQLSAWTPSSFIECIDGKTRRTQPGLFPLVDGVSARVGKLRAYGNAIVPQVAATFIRAAMEGLCFQNT